MQIDFITNMKSSRASMFYMYGCVLANFAFLSIVRGIAQREWILLDEIPSNHTIAIHPKNYIHPNWYQYLLGGISLGLSVITQICIRIRSKGWKMKPCTIIAFVCILLQITLLSITIYTFNLKYPLTEYAYSPGGLCGCFTGILSNTLAGILFALDILILHSKYKQQTVEQKKHYIAHSLFTLYIIAGALIFMWIENWQFERSAEYCLMTLLTIGYGNIVPQSVFGRTFMMFYTLFGLAGNDIYVLIIVAGLFILSFEEIVETSELERKLLNTQSEMDTSDTQTVDQQNVQVNTDECFLENNSNKALSTIEEPTVFKYISVGLLAMIWLGVGSWVFAIFEDWTYFEGLYFGFVSITVIIDGDFQIKNPWSIEFWWVFLYNAISILVYSITMIGKRIGTRLAQRERLLAEQRRLRRLKQIQMKNQVNSPTSDVTEVERRNQELNAQTFPLILQDVRQRAADTIWLIS
ncbi:hypothetical protein BC833DRAFT_620132 [Globomyces pollinis-pini]|nr:hypothetical protein BC833DRAFT_620132 [Globomyces pollinis-pini]